MQGDRKIGVAMDFSRNSKFALRWAMDNLLNNGGTLYFIHIRPDTPDEPRTVLSSSTSLIPFTELRDSDSMKRDEVEIDPGVQDMLDTIFKLKEPKVNLATKIYWNWGDAREKICEAVGELNLDSLVMGSRGLGPLTSILMGSVTNYVVANATCPVTVVKDPNFHK